MYIEKKYISFLSSRLLKFKWKSGILANCRCPFCGDSKTNPNKARFYFYTRSNKWFTVCHNCSYSATFPKFLKKIDEKLYSEYIIEVLSDNKPIIEDSQFVDELRFDNEDAFKTFIKLDKISSLPLYHPAKKYVDSRKIPNPYHAIFRWCPNFMEWSNKRIPGKFKPEALEHDEGRILIPFFNKNNHFFAYTGRSLSPIAEVRYITIVLNSKELLLWGANKIDYERPIKVTEGPIDATFLNNCIALAGNSISSLTNLAERDRFIIVLDNEPHSKEAKKKFSRAIDQGFKVVLFPNNIKEKDINAMVLAGYSPDYLEYVINNNIYSDIEARMKLEEWSKR